MAYFWISRMWEPLLPFLSFSLPHLIAFLVFSLCHLSGSSVLGILTTCSGLAGFLSCKRALHCATAFICEPISLSFPLPHSSSFPPTLVLGSDLCISIYFLCHWNHLCLFCVFKKPSSLSSIHLSPAVFKHVRLRDACLWAISRRASGVYSEQKITYFIIYLTNSCILLINFDLYSKIKVIMINKVFKL